MPPCEVDVIDGPGPVVVLLRGDLDVACAEDVQRRLDALVAEAARPLLVRLDALTFLDSLGVQALLLVAQAARAHQREVTWSPPSAAAAHALRTAGAGPFLGWHDAGS